MWTYNSARRYFRYSQVALLLAGAVNLSVFYEHLPNRIVGSVMLAYVILRWIAWASWIKPSFGEEQL